MGTFNVHYSNTMLAREFYYSVFDIFSMYNSYFWHYNYVRIYHRIMQFETLGDIMYTSLQYSL